MRIGIDVGGTKIEALALDAQGVEIVRHRIQTPRDDYAGTLKALADIVALIEQITGETGTVGIGIPGCISQRTGLVKNSNCTWINHQALDRDLGDILGRVVRIENDANCFAVSEATDGAAAGKRAVFGVILGTGCGGGLSIDGRSFAGPNSVAGEWGHNPLPWPDAREYPGPECYCGKRGCLEQWISGTGIELDYKACSGLVRTTREIVAASEDGDPVANAAIERFEDRLARGLSVIINILDPDVIVVGGGVSNLDRLYRSIPERLPGYVFGAEVSTPVFRAVHGDSSGVRGAAWLWPN
jgi:fructokinase